MSQQPERSKERMICFCTWTVLSDYLGYEEFLTWHLHLQARPRGLISLLTLHFKWIGECLKLHCSTVPGSSPCMEKLHQSEPNVLTAENSQAAVKYFFGFLFTDQVVLSHLHMTRKTNSVPGMNISCKP